MVVSRHQRSGQTWQHSIARRLRQGQGEGRSVPAAERLQVHGGQQLQPGAHSRAGGPGPRQVTRCENAPLSLLLPPESCSKCITCETSAVFEIDWLPGSRGE